MEEREKDLERKCREIKRLGELLGFPEGGRKEGGLKGRYNTMQGRRGRWNEKWMKVSQKHMEGKGRGRDRQGKERNKSSMGTEYLTPLCAFTDAPLRNQSN